MNSSAENHAIGHAPAQWEQLFRSSVVSGPSTATSFWSTEINTGFRLSICREGILAIPAGAKESFKLGVASQAHGLLEGMLKAASEQPPVMIVDHGDRRWLRFPVNELGRVICKRDRFGLARHKIVVERSDGSITRFGFYVRSDFKPTSRVLQSVFGDLVLAT